MGQFDIEEVRRVGRTKNYTTNEIAMQYTVLIRGKETQLYEDSGRWFVLMRT